ncbi:bacterial transcriptional activator domain-containing protein [Ideonella sp. 4Y16]|uniref:AfsR/SARP family transcriptional regulator n=1 Tax=Ideonella alba TaxID=2824118 RepID=UPI001B37BAED|nr:bacterial transcriptional activator domain-containing protein [Ideonella alba]MBQ0944844.1 bacterial transcriptional activator domain-containing protein [Ideonella alba]
MDLTAALALLVDDELRARAALEALFAQATLQRDDALADEAAVGILLGIGLNYVDFRGRQRWCGYLHERLDTSEASALLTHAAVGDPAAMRRCGAALVLPYIADDPSLLPPPWLNQVAQALLRGLHNSERLPPSQRLVLAKVLFDHFSMQLDTTAVSRVQAVQQERLLLDPLSPAEQAQWWLLVLGHAEYFGEMEAARQARQRLEALVERHGLKAYRTAELCGEMQLALRERQLDRAARIDRELEGLMPELRAGFLVQCLRAQASYRAFRGDNAMALALTDRLLALCGDLEVPERDQGAYHGLRANILAATGRFDDALRVLQGLRASQTGSQAEILETMIAFVEVAARLDTQPDVALDRLGSALADAARLGYTRFLMTAPALSARLCQLALDAGIEPEFVHSVIRDRHLSAPDPTRADWPRPVAVQVLGPMGLSRQGTPIASAGKAQRKPLELLALLAAHGGGPLGSDQVIDALWPSLEADAPKASLEMAVSRLRKLLACPEAVLVSQGTVALDPDLVWCDAVAFEQLSARLRERLAAGHAPLDALAHDARRLFGLYRGRLLGTDTLTGPMRLARERLSLTYLQSIEAWGQALEARGDWPGALALYRQAVGVDPLAEPLHRALMRALLVHGERAEALRAYRRCCDALGSALGVGPGAGTQALGRAAGAPELPA